MKKIVLVICGLTSLVGTIHAQTVTAGMTNNGINVIPSFSLNKPAITTAASLNLSKHIEYDPDFACALADGKGWYTDQWVRWNQSLDTAGKWVATVGFDWQMYFQPISTFTGDPIMQMVHYPTYEAKVKFSPNSKNAFVIDYWYTSAVEERYGVKAHYAAASYIRTTDMKKFVLNGTLTCYYLNSTDNSVGIIGWVDVNLSHKKSGLFIDLQAINKISADNVPFAWSATFGIARKVF